MHIARESVQKDAHICENKKMHYMTEKLLCKNGYSRQNFMQSVYIRMDSHKDVFEFSREEVKSVMKSTAR